MKSILSYITPALGLMASTTTAITMDLNDKASVNSAMATIAYDMLTYYKGNLSGNVPGILPGPCQSPECYYWWQAGAMWGGLINYWQYSGDDSYQPTVIQSLKFQIGEDKNYNPGNQSKNMGVDDQDFWGFAAMEAAEAGIPDAGGDTPSWLALAQAVFNFQYLLWDDKTCGGGFRWQVFSFNPGYNLKNTISNGGFFNLAARLARYTGNQTYADWAEKTWDWMITKPIWDKRDDGTLYIWDNTDTKNNCADAELHTWSYNYGTTLMGAAMLYNFTNGGEKWRLAIEDILTGAERVFFTQQYGGGQIMAEVLCEDNQKCNNDQSSFKAYLSRWMAVTAVIAPFTHDRIMAKLRTSAVGAAKQCTGGTNGRQCGRRWYDVWDNSLGVGQQMSALAVIGATQMTPAMAPLTLNTGGTSKSDPSAGIDAPHNPLENFNKITDGDRAGAAILTMLVIGFVVGLSIWIVV